MRIFRNLQTINSKSSLIMKARLFRSILLMLATAFSLPVAAQTPDNFLWPIQGKTAGDDILCRPQEYVDKTQNDATLYVSAPAGTVVVVPADGTVEVATVGYQPYINQLQLFQPKSLGQSWSAMLDEVRTTEKDISVPLHYVTGMVTLRLADGRKLHITGLEGDVALKTGTTVHRGDVLGIVGYAYRYFKEPHISIALSKRNNSPDDPMKPFGLKSTFIPPEERKVPETLTRAQALEDFDVLEECLNEAYPSLYDVISREELAAEDSVVRARLMRDEAISYREFYLAVRRFLSSIHDSHLEILTSNPVLGTQEAYIPNIWLEIEGDTAVIDNSHPEFKRYWGRKVTAINGESIADLKQRLRRHIDGADGDNESWADYRFIGSWSTIYADSLAWPRTTVLTLDDGEEIVDKWRTVSESRIMERFRFVGKRNYPLRFNQSIQAPFRTLVLNDSVGYFHLSHFNLNQVQIEQLRDSLRPLFRLPYLVADMRYNNGGDYRVLRQLLSWFLNAPERHPGSYSRVTKPGPFHSFAHALNYDSTMVLFPQARPFDKGTGYVMNDSAVVLQPDTAFNYTGRLYVLTDETSVSAATLFPATLVRNHRAVTVGRETRSGYHFMTAVNFVQLQLPHSLIQFLIPLVQAVYDPLCTPRTPWNRGLLPDYPVPITIEEVARSEQDLVLARALGLIATGQYLGPDPFPQETAGEVTDWPMKATWITIILLAVYMLLRLTLFRKSAR